MAEGGHRLDEPVVEEAAQGKSGAPVHGIHIDCLPVEVMINIFAYLSFNDLIDTVQKVCTRWERLAHYPALWLNKEYVIRKRGWPLEGRSCCGVVFTQCVHCRCEERDEEILQTAGTVPQLRTLTLMRHVGAHILRKICANCPNLTSLQFHFSQDMDYSLLEYILEKCPKIQKLTLVNDLLADRQCAELVSGLEHLRSLKMIQGNMAPRTLPVLLRVLADGCPRLEEIHIHLSWDNFSADDLEYFLKAKKHSLTSATLPSAVPGTMSVVPLLKQCGTSLRKLRLRGYYCYDDVEMQATAFEALGELHSLRELYLRAIPPSEPQVISLAFRPGCLTQLQRLRLVHMYDLQDETLVAISRGCPNLCELRIRGSSITDTALSEIDRLKHLEILELGECCELWGDAVGHIARLPALHTLVLKHLCMIQLQPSLQHIVDLKELRRLVIVTDGSMEAVPFHEFPGRLMKLRELHVKCEREKELCWENLFPELQRKMPHLKIFDTVPLTEDDEEADRG